MTALPLGRASRLATILIVAIANLTTGIGAATAQTGGDALLATATIQVTDGELTWRAVNASTIAESDPAQPFEPGFAIALDDPLLLLFDDGARLERVPADTAFALSEPLEGHPVAMLSDAPASYLGVELLAFDAATADPEAIAFPVTAGDYELTLWRLDPVLPLAPEYIERLGALTLPMLAYVREGAVDVPSSAGGEPERLEAGGWTVIAPGVTLTPVEGQAPPILLLATLDQPRAEAPDGPAVSQPQGGGTARQPSTGQIPTQAATTAATQPPTLPPTTVATEAPVPTVAPTDIPAPDTDEGGFDPGPGDVEQNCEDFFADSDGDGVGDACELERGTDPNVPNSGDTGPGDSAAGSSGCAADLVIICFEEGAILSRSSGPDTEAAESGISVTDEVNLTCSATVADGDGDGLVDACEAEFGANPAKPDSDGDTLIDGDEVYTHKTDPIKTDTDDDSLSDADEVYIHQTSPVLVDSDGDSLGDGNEVDTHRTNPAKADSDGDGLNDGDEVNTFGTYPKVADSDDDGLIDGDEIAYGSDPFVADTDGDCMPDANEVFDGTNPAIPDLDEDGNNACTFDTDLD